MNFNKPDKLQDRDILKGLVAGAVGGMVASVAMNQFQSMWQKLKEGQERAHGAQSMQQGLPQRGAGRILQEKGKDDPDDDATERLSNFISEEVFDHDLTEGEKDLAGTAFHYGFGLTVGGVYGMAAELLPEVAIGAGLPYGALIWVTADEGVVPLLGLSKSPSELPFSKLAYSFSSHLVYGLTAEIVRRALRRKL
ncbi:conserved hypothetical protein [Candidatus Methylobacter favarea]|uniref:DUF1440 domain-containing protein n=1 Tax=Candidatus Methylobacter favarea TaxID=2707345 RepID=A0A8S0X7L9_9GAMM|nr:DUF1440 domain-containing protein [Candidatus Methylobacter favarea]CAA9890187.1 conserved hypothetical protein [Candidatus Methylobacter favarea]